MGRNDVKVVEVRRDLGKADIRVDGVTFHFQRRINGKLIFAKSSSAQIYDHTNLYVSEYLFKRVLRKAAAILL